jgi:hypothetical protein
MVESKEFPVIFPVHGNLLGSGEAGVVMGDRDLLPLFGACALKAFERPLQPFHRAMIACICFHQRLKKGVSKHGTSNAEDEIHGRPADVRRQT